MSEYATYPSLRDRAVFITGGASGIGESMVRLFAGQGAKVGFVDIQAERGNTVACTAQEAGARHQPLFLECDVTDIAALKRAIDEVARAFGSLEVLVNNAASDDRHRWDEVTVAYWDERFATNLRHQFFAIQAAVPHMRRAGGGSIINIGSASWMIKEDFFVAYATAKSAVQGLTTTLARTLGPDNIRVNTVLPGWIFTERQLDKWWTPEGEAAAMDLQCIKKRIYPDEFNQIALFLAADDGGACTAQSFIVDGGRAGI